jgi:hypothetical protein
MDLKDWEDGTRERWAGDMKIKLCGSHFLIHRNGWQRIGEGSAKGLEEAEVVKQRMEGRRRHGDLWANFSRDQPHSSSNRTGMS